MRRYCEVMIAEADRAINGWLLGRPFQIHPEMQQISLVEAKPQALTREMFGVPRTRFQGWTAPPRQAGDSACAVAV